jgi:adenosylmethionine-8-amino-7-oxononanoate aminotransferase
LRAIHGHTYQAHPVACAAALAVQKVIADDHLIESVNVMGERLMSGLTERLGNHHHVGDIRGRGLFRAIELVADRAGKTPFDPKLKLNERIEDAAFTHGLAIYPMGGTLDSKYGDHICIPPRCIAMLLPLNSRTGPLGLLGR